MENLWKSKFLHWSSHDSSFLMSLVSHCASVADFCLRFSSLLSVGSLWSLLQGLFRWVISSIDGAHTQGLPTGSVVCRGIFLQEESAKDTASTSSVSSHTVQWLSVIQRISVTVLLIFQRSDQWRAEISLFDSGARVCPLNAKVTQ